MAAHRGEKEFSKLSTYGGERLDSPGRSVTGRSINFDSKIGGLPSSRIQAKVATPSFSKTLHQSRTMTWLGTGQRRQPVNFDSLLFRQSTYLNTATETSERCCGQSKRVAPQLFNMSIRRSSQFNGGQSSLGFDALNIGRGAPSRQYTSNLSRIAAGEFHNKSTPYFAGLQTPSKQ